MSHASPPLRIEGANTFLPNSIQQQKPTKKSKHDKSMGVSQTLCMILCFPLTMFVKNRTSWFNKKRYINKDIHLDIYPQVIR